MQILNKTKFVIALVISAVSAFIFAHLIKQSFYTLTISDFLTYYYIPRAVLHLSRPEHPYSNLVPYYPFFYPPQSIPLFGLLSFLPFYLAKYFWTLLNVLLAIYSIYIINSFFNKKIGLEFWAMLLGMVLFYPFQFTLTDGQFNIVMLFFFVLVAKLFISNRNFKLSLPLALGIVTKISPLVVFLYLLIKRKYKAIIYTLVFILFLTIIAEVFVGKGITYYYVRYVINDVSKQAGTPSFMDQSILGLLKRFDFSNDIIKSLVSYFITFILVSIVLIRDYFNNNNKEHFLITYSGLVLVGIIGTGLAWYHQFVVLLLPLYVGLLYTIRLNNNRKYFLILTLLFSYFLMAINLTDVFTGFFQLTLLFGSLLLFFVLIYLSSTKPLIKHNLRLSKTQNLIVTMLFLGVLFIFINPFTFNEFLKEGRDRARIRDIDYTGQVLSEYKPEFKVGQANSFVKNEKIDEGYILFTHSNGNFRQDLSLLLLDPINNEKFNYNFISNNQHDFKLSARLESDLYKDKFGEFYSYMCVNKVCSQVQNIK